MRHYTPPNDQIYLLQVQQMALLFHWLLLLRKCLCLHFYLPLSNFKVLLYLCLRICNRSYVFRNHQLLKFSGSSRHRQNLLFVDSYNACKADVEHALVYFKDKWGVQLLGPQNWGDWILGILWVNGSLFCVLIGVLDFDQLCDQSREV